MINTLEIRVVAASPQKPLPPWVAFQGSPSSVRVIDVPKSVGTWQITGVQVQVLYPNNQSIVKEAVRTGSVWVATIEGCETAGKVIQGYQITASGKDENNNPVEGFILGAGDVFIMEVSNDIKALVGKTAVRYLDDLPTTPVEGDMYLANGTMKFFTGSEWVDFGGGGSTGDLVTKEEFNEYKEEVSTSLSAIDSSLSILSASVSTMGESISTISASVSTLTSSISTLSSTKRDYSDKSWKYTKTTDPVMYGVEKFFLTRDEDGQESHSYDLMDFDETTKVWSEYESPITVKAYSPTLYAVIDENNPHTFEFDDEQYNGWEFYRINDSDTSFTVSGGGANIEYHITLTRRSDDSFAMQSDVNSKRDYADITWDYPMDADKDMFGVGYFTVDTGTQAYLRDFSNVVDVEENVWKTWSSIGTNGWKIDTLDGHHYNLYRITSGTSTKVGEFTRTSDTNLQWDVSTGSSSEVLVRAFRRESGTLAVYQPNVNDAAQRYLMFGQSSSSAGVVICDDVSAKANSFIKVDEMMITGPNYTSSRGVQMRGVRDVDNHLKVNGSAIAFVNEVEAVSADVSTMASSITSIDASVSAMASSMSNIEASISAIDGQVSAMTTTLNGKRNKSDVGCRAISYDNKTYGIRFFAVNTSSTNGSFYTKKLPLHDLTSGVTTWQAEGANPPLVTTSDGETFTYTDPQANITRQFSYIDLNNDNVKWTDEEMGLEYAILADFSLPLYFQFCGGISGRISPYTVSLYSVEQVSYGNNQYYTRLTYKGGRGSYIYYFKLKQPSNWTETYYIYESINNGSQTYIGSFDIREDQYTENEGSLAKVSYTKTPGGFIGPFDCVKWWRNGNELLYKEYTSGYRYEVPGGQRLLNSTDLIVAVGDLHNNVGYMTSTSSVFTELTASVSTMASSINGLGSAISTIDSTLSTMAGSMLNMSSSISTLNGNVQTLTSSVSALTSTMSSVTAQVSSMASVVEEVASSVSTLDASVFSLDQHMWNTVDPALSEISNKRDYYSMGLECFQDEGNNTFHTDVARLGINAITFEFEQDVPSGSPSIYNLTSFSWIQEADPDIGQPSIARWYSPEASESRFYVDAEVVDDWTVNFNIYDDTTGSPVMGAWQEYLLWNATGYTNWDVDGSYYDVHTTLSMVSTRIATMQDLQDEIDSVMNVSGIGCSTITMSGVYANSSSFSFDVVIQPSA